MRKKTASRQSEHFVPALQQTVFYVSIQLCTVLYRTALSVRAVEVVRTSFEVSSYFAGRRLASLD